MRRPVVMGNWKLNGSKAMVTDLINGLNMFEGVEGVDVAIAPPALYIDLAELQSKKVAISLSLVPKILDLNNSGAFW